MVAGRMSLVARGRNQGRNGRIRRYKNAHGKKTYQRFAPSRWSPSISLCPDRMFVRLRYSETLNFTQGGPGVVVDNIFRGNCHIDCNVSAPGPGFSAYGAQQWSTFYGRCYATASSLRIKAITDQDNVVQVTTFPSNSFAPVASSQLAAQRPRKRATLTSQFADIKTLSNRASTKAIIGENRTSQMNYNSDTATQVYPVADWYWHIVTETEAGVAGPMVILVELDYNVLFFDRKQTLGAISGGGPSQT